MKQTEIAEHFQVSRQAVADWKRRGCPVGGDAGAIAGWKLRRELQLAGVEADEDFIRLFAEVERRKFSLNERLTQVNGIDWGTKGEPGLMKAAIVHALCLEKELLSVPGRIMSRNPSEMVEATFDAVLHAHDAARGEVAGKGAEK